MENQPKYLRSRALQICNWVFWLFCGTLLKMSETRSTNFSFSSLKVKLERKIKIKQTNLAKKINVNFWILDTKFHVLKVFIFSLFSFCYHLLQFHLPDYFFNSVFWKAHETFAYLLGKLFKKNEMSRGIFFLSNLFFKLPFYCFFLHSFLVKLTIVLICT